jgi:hypothetical protein
MSAQLAAYLFLNIPAHVIRHIIYISHKKGYFGIPEVISPTLAPEAVGDLQSHAQASTKYTKVPNSYTHKIDMLVPNLCTHKNVMLACIGQFYLMP